MSPRAFKMAVLLGTLSCCLSRGAETATPLLVMKCSEPKGSMITLEDGKIQQGDDAISKQNYTIVIYRPDKSGVGRAIVIAEGKNNLEEHGNYRAYGSQDSIAVDVSILYNEATWTYSLFPKDHLLFIHSTKLGMIGNPTAQLFVATCS